jgi:uncharacterized protein with ATP-grasp and redox domains
MERGDVVLGPLSCAVAGSFAARTMSERVPALLEGTRALNAFAPDIDAAVAALVQEMRAGLVHALVDDEADRVEWNRAVAPYVGGPWSAMPWYLAESYCYRRLLEATRWFANARDPFAPHKAREWVEAEALLARTLPNVPGDDDDTLRALLFLALWGNRADLSLDARSHGAATASDLLVDDSDAALRALQAADHVTIVLDNAGTELAFDLLLVHALLARGVRVTLQAKAQPFFVSDAMVVDVDEGVRVLGRVDAARAQLLTDARADGRLQVRAHAHFTTSAFHDDVPPDLRAALNASDLVIWKGDCNYRRLVRDTPWPPTTPFADIVKDVPGRLVALRTCKADVVCGLAPGVAARAAAVDVNWLVSGRFGLVQARLGLTRA